MYNEPTMVAPLLPTKFYIPSPRVNGIRRPHLVKKIRDGLDQPGGITLLSGPAGFGKTTLLSELVGQLENPPAWLSLEEDDNDPIRFWTYLIKACQSIQGNIGAAALALLRGPQALPLEAIPALLVNDLSGLEHNLLLILDDFHAIQNESIHSGLTFLLEHSPAHFHLIVSTRMDPPWPLARYRAKNRLVEVRAQELRFTVQEAQDFLIQAMGLELTPADAKSLEEHTEGWAAGLQLAALSMQGRKDISGFVKTFTGSHTFIAEYLVEEVLQRQSPEVQEFLLKTSLLERLNPALCETVAGCQDGQSMLTRLQRMNLFITALDDERQWFRYHHLFADLLQAHLRQSSPAEEVQTLHQRAADWYERTGMTAEAIPHLQAAGNTPRLARLVGKAALPMIMQAGVTTLESWLRAVPADYAGRDPKILMSFAWLNLLRGTVPQAQAGWKMPFVGCCGQRPPWRSWD